MFLAAYEVDPCISRAAKAAKCARSNHSEWLNSNEAYRAAFEQAHETMVDSLEHEARRRAVEGIPRYRFNGKGEPIYDPNKVDPETGEHELLIERHYSDRLLELLLKRHRPVEFGVKTELTVAGKMGMDLSGEVASVSDVLEQIHSNPEYVQFLQWQAENAIPDAPIDGA